MVNLWIHRTTFVLGGSERTNRAWNRPRERERETTGEHMIESRITTKIINFVFGRMRIVENFARDFRHKIHKSHTWAGQFARRTSEIRHKKKKLENNEADALGCIFEFDEHRALGLLADCHNISHGTCIPTFAYVSVVACLLWSFFQLFVSLSGRTT